MKPWKVNADYESVLFGNRPGPAIINQSLEFLVFFLEDEPLFTDKKYDPAYLKYLEKVTGKIPSILSQGSYENWWGALRDLNLERKLNSKEFTTQFNQDTFLYTGSEHLALDPSSTYLAKNPFGMSGQNFLKFKGSEIEKLQTFSQKFKMVLIEPFFNRQHDFSYYVFSDGREICYQNLVDENFQYKGTFFLNRKHLAPKNLSFYHDVPSAEWEKFIDHKEQIKSVISKLGVNGGYSIDSFTYSENGSLKIRTISEVNYRKTMGYVTWKLAEKYSGSDTWSALLLARAKEKLSFTERLQRMEKFKGAKLLSPGDTRFEIFFLSASSHEEGIKMINGLKELLPDCEFTIEI